MKKIFKRLSIFTAVLLILTIALSIFNTEYSEYILLILSLFTLSTGMLVSIVLSEVNQDKYPGSWIGSIEEEDNSLNKDYDFYPDRD